MSDYKYRYTNKHGKMTDGMNKGNTCRRKRLPTDEQTMHAKRCAHEQMIMQRCVRRWKDEKTCKMFSQIDG